MSTINIPIILETATAYTWARKATTCAVSATNIGFVLTTLLTM